MIHEFQHGLFKHPLVHLPVSKAHSGLRHQLPEPSRELLHTADVVIYEVYLPAASNLLQYGLTYYRIAVFHYIRLHGIALGGRRLYHGHIAYARHGHVQRPRDRRGGKRQHVHGLAYVLYLLLMAYAEALLLVYYEKPQILELYAL